MVLSWVAKVCLPEITMARSASAGASSCSMRSSKYFLAASIDLSLTFRRCFTALTSVWTQIRTGL